MGNIAGATTRHRRDDADFGGWDGDAGAVAGGAAGGDLFQQQRHPFGLARTVSYAVDDGQGVNHVNNAMTWTVNVAAVNDTGARHEHAELYGERGRGGDQHGGHGERCGQRDAGSARFRDHGRLHGGDVLSFTNDAATMGNIGGNAGLARVMR